MFINKLTRQHKFYYTYIKQVGVVVW